MKNCVSNFHARAHVYGSIIKSTAYKESESALARKNAFAFFVTGHTKRDGERLGAKIAKAIFRAKAYVSHKNRGKSALA